MRSSFLGLIAAAATLATAAPAHAKAHCWCAAAKADCGSCDGACVLNDFGAIAELRDLDVRKNDLCRAACVEKIRGQAKNDLCLALRDRLHVPLPWHGALSSCARVGATGTHRDVATQIDCATATAPTPQGPWKLAFFDDFKGRAGSSSPASCFDRPASCWAIYRAGPVPCPAGAQAALKDLDKCRWTLLSNVNWMMSMDHMDAFDAREVRVDPARDGGVLVLSAHGYKPDGTRHPDPAFKVKNGKRVSKDPYLRQPPAGYDCVWGDSLAHDRCPIRSGAIVSADLGPDGPSGFKQAYGKWEVRAKASYGPGSFPAFWMLPQTGSWPGANELDILEVYTEGDDAHQGFVGGVCLPSGARDLDPAACTSGGGTRWLQGKSSGIVKGPWWIGYHVYAVEWAPGFVRFSIDGRVTNELRELDLVNSRKMDYQPKFTQKLWPWSRDTWERKLAAHMPDSPFYWLLNQSIKKDGDHKYPNPADFVPEELLVDWVKVWTR